MSERVCSNCQRPSYLWGSERCDVCVPDSDGDGVDDREQGPRASVAPTLFPTEEKGWEMVGPPKFTGNTKEKVCELKRRWLQSRACSWELAEFRKHLHPELREVGIPSA